MNPTIEGYVNVRRRADELGIASVPDIALLPRGFATASSPDDLAHEGDAATLEKVLAEAGVAATRLQPVDGRYPVVIEKHVDWIAPVIFVSSDLLLHNAEAITTLLRFIQDFVVAYVTNRLPTGKVQLSFVVETSPDSTYKKLTFEGSPKRIREIGEVLKSLSDE